MTRLLEASGFLGLTVAMSIGVYQGYLFTVEGAPPFWVVNTHVHLGVLSILAVVTGFAVDILGLTGRMRHVVSGLYVVGQWSLPFTWWVAFGTGNEPIMSTLFLWGFCLIASMAIMTWQTARATRSSTTSPPDGRLNDGRPRSDGPSRPKR